ncbi:MAG: carboxynorspermidine decarboxylase [Clostridia bacterium]|nr:carboxynorspermidine decarboxylase [Clostridia bacterium]
MNLYNMQTIPTPSYVTDEALLIQNLTKLKELIDETDCHILLAQKCFSMYATYPLISRYLSGTTASGLYEAKLGKTYMGKETHIFSAAYREDEMEEIITICDHIVFNSLSQWKRYKERVLAAGREVGLRINPECSTQEHQEQYDPCSKYSRLGIRSCDLNNEVLEGVSGLHFHTLCEQNADALKVTLDEIERKFGSYLHKMKWINFGGGHHITRADYDIDLLKLCIKRMQETYDLNVYIEPGEAVALDAGFLVSTVLDIVENGCQIAIMDCSAACHMPDVLEMPYTPRIAGAKICTGDQNIETTENAYRLAGPTCLAGDVIGDYIFDKPLKVGDRVCFCDMAIYSMVKNNTFNGMKLPSIALKQNGGIVVIKEFGYEDFKERLS